MNRSNVPVLGPGSHATMESEGVRLECTIPGDGPLTLLFLSVMRGVAVPETPDSFTPAEIAANKEEK